jgi:hypothetical protein
VNARQPRGLSRSARSRPSCEFRNHGPLGTVALRQCEWNGTDGKKQEKIKCASDKMCFDGGINLLFHVGVVLGRTLSSKRFRWNPDFPVGKLDFGIGHPF